MIEKVNLLSTRLIDFVFATKRACFRAVFVIARFYGNCVR
jgi:hypothetical protein